MKLSIPRLIIPSMMTTKPASEIAAIGSSAATSSADSCSPSKLLEQSLSQRYYRRLELDPTLLDVQPTIGKLQHLTEAHVRNIPFENIAQHGATGGLQTLDLPTIVDKILNRNRGGFCFELHTLFSYWLRNELQYPIVRNVEATVFGSDGFNCPSMHMVLIVQTCDGITPGDDDENSHNSTNNLYFVDVGFGEPPIHPLEYVMDTVQVTPEGMISKLSKDKDDDDYVVLYWYKDREWVPRLRWNYTDSMVMESSSDRLIGPLFEPLLRRTHEAGSQFRQKLIVCTVSRTQKTTLAGNKLKITGPPRFARTSSVGNENEDHEDHGKNGDQSEPPPPPPAVTTELKDDGEIREAMFNVFGIPFEETRAMDFTKSIEAKPEVWSGM